MHDDFFLEDFWSDLPQNINQLRDIQIKKDKERNDFLLNIYKTVPLDIDKRLSFHYKNNILNNGLFIYGNLENKSDKMLPKIGIMGLSHLSENNQIQKDTKDFLIYINNIVSKDIHAFMDLLFIKSYALLVFHKKYEEMSNYIKNEVFVKTQRYIPIYNLYYCYINHKTGLNNKFCCPFHEEKTPSMRYSLSEQNFYCFGCGYKINIFGLTAVILGINVIEAIYIICKIYNIKPQIFRYPKMQYTLSIWKHLLPI